MPPTKKKSSSASSSAAAAALLAELDETDDTINWLQNPHSTSSTTSNDPTLPPLLSHLSTLDSALTCPICHATPLSIPVTLTTCSHTFCSLCLQSNLRSQQQAQNGTTTNTSCPVCRKGCDDRNVVRNTTLEVVCGIWGTVRGEVRDRIWYSSLGAADGSSGDAVDSSDGNDADDIDGGNGNGRGSSGGGKKRAAAAAVSASSASSSSSSSSSAAGGGRKRPRRSASRRGSGRRAAAASAAGSTAEDGDDGDSSPPSSSEEDSGEEYEDDGSDDGGSDVEFVSKSGSGGGSNNGKGTVPPAAARSASTATAKSNGTSKIKSSGKSAKSYPSDAEHLAAIGSTIDPAGLDRARSLPGNLTGLKRPQMTKLLSSYGLSTSGQNLDGLKDRYRAFRMLYNAQCMSARPAPIAQLVGQVHAEEKARDRERRLAMMNGSGRVADEMRRLNAKWNEEKVDGSGEEVGGGGSRAADVPDKVKTGFAALLAEGKRRCKEQGWRMGERKEEEDATAAAAAAAAGGGSGKKIRKWEDDDGEVGAQEEEKKDDDAEEPIVLDDESDDDEEEDDDDDRKPSAAEAATKAAEDSINGPQDAMDEASCDGEVEAQISRSPSSESPRTVRASSSSDGLVGSAAASASSVSASASASASAKKSSSAKKSKPSPRQSYQQTPQPRECQPASVDTRSIRNNSTPSTIGPWSCGACTFYNEINIGSRDKCEVCETPRPRPISRPSRNVASFDC